MRGLRIGEMDRRIIIEQPVDTIDDYTHEKKTVWQALATVYAKRLGPISKESFEDRQQVDQAITKYIVRFRSDFTSVMRVKDAGKIGYIESVEGADRNSYLILQTITRDNG